jgi:hypothetical protein
MMEFTVNDLRDLAKGQTERAEEYCTARRAAGEAKVALDLLLTVDLARIRGLKKNCGIDMAYSILMEENDEAKEYFSIWQKNESLYKSLEKLLEAYSSRIMIEQSIMRYQREGEKWGS